MARNVAPLKVPEIIKKAKKPGRHAFGNRVYLDNAGAAPVWLLRYGLRGKETFAKLGDVDMVRLGASLQDARTLAAELLTGRARGVDPQEAMRAKKGNSAGRPRLGHVTFREAYTSFLVANGDTWSNEAHATEWRRSVEHYGQSLMGKPVHEITVQDIEACMSADWKRVPVTAQRTLRRLKHVFDHAIGKGWRTAGNPAELGPVKQALGTVKREERHHAALPWKDLPAFMRKLQAVRGDDAETADCLRFIILTAARLQEGRDVVRGEIDTDAKLWTVPGKRMKRRKVHRVPMSDAALTLVEDRPRTAADLVFAGVSRSAPYELLEKLGLQKGEATVHGFRSSFDDWATDNRIAYDDVIEAALAHRKRDKTTRAYRRTDHLEARVPLMDRWAMFLADDPRWMLQEQPKQQAA